MYRERHWPFHYLPAMLDPLHTNRRECYEACLRREFCVGQTVHMDWPYPGDLTIGQCYAGTILAMRSHSQEKPPYLTLLVRSLSSRADWFGDDVIAMLSECSPVDTTVPTTAARCSVSGQAVTLVVLLQSVRRSLWTCSIVVCYRQFALICSVC
jgi:hypothetical protein